jgi:hypothetical protein
MRVAICLDYFFELSSVSNEEIVVDNLPQLKFLVFTSRYIIYYYYFLFFRNSECIQKYLF